MAQERAVLAGGCFWGMQDLIRYMNGVTDTCVGYTGGDVPNATYRNHGTHAEGIERHCQIKLICYGGLRIWAGFENRCLAICQAIQRVLPNL